MAAGACKERARAIIVEMAAKMNLTQARYLAYSLLRLSHNNLFNTNCSFQFLRSKKKYLSTTRLSFVHNWF